MTRQVNYFKKEPPGTWAEDAACRGSHGTHFPDAPVNSPEWQRQVEVAKGICKGCPVRELCLGLALRNNEREGVWGGQVFDHNTKRRIGRNRLRQGLK